MTQPDSFRFRSGHAYLDAYKGSTIPYVSSSIALSGTSPADVVSIEFPHVSKNVTIKNTTSAALASAAIRVGFSANGVVGQGYAVNTTGSFGGGPNNNYVLLDNEESYSADHRVTRVYLVMDVDNTGTCQVAAGLTTIPHEDLKNNWSGSAGVG